QNSQTGRSDERVLLFRLLSGHPLLQGMTNSLKWFTKGDGRMREDNWDKVIEDAERFEQGKSQKFYHIGRYRKLRPGIREKYYRKLDAKLPFTRYKGIYELIQQEEKDSVINVITALCS